MRRLTIVLICFALMMSAVLGGCASSGEDVPSAERIYRSPDSVHETASGQVASNERFKLFWDNDQKCLLLTDSRTSKIWSTIPYDFYSLPDTDGIAKVRMGSPIYLEYLDSATTIKTSYGYVDALTTGMVEAGRTAHGFKVTYYFDGLEISVPVLYVLQDDGLEVRLLVDEIRENAKKVYSVSIAPFFCAAKAGTDSYLFVPSGSGALMETEESSRGVRTFSGRVYGNDKAIDAREQFVNETPVRLPVFGVKEGNDAVCAVIGKGAELSRIDAQAGDTEIGYASVYATFELRSRNQIAVKGNNNFISISTRLSDEIVDTDYASVTYYPLTGEDADYTGMAKLYRDTLFPDGAPSAEETALYLQFLGGTTVQKNILGIPYKTLEPATTFAQAQSILQDLSGELSVSMAAELTGFGKTGLDIGKIAGGLGFGGAFGKVADLAALRDYCEKNSVPLFADFDVINYNSTGNGVSAFSDCVKTINHTRAVQQVYKKTTYTNDERYPTWYLLRLDKLSGVMDDLKALLNKHQLTGVSLRSLSSVTYSDSSTAEHYAKNGFPELVSAQLRKLKKDGKRIASADANDYAAVLSDYIAAAPTTSAKADGFDVEVPFYQMVFKGAVPIAVPPLNAAADLRTQFLKAMESGSALSFSLCDTWSLDFADSKQQDIHGSVYSGWKDEIIRLTNEAKPLLEAVSGASIVAHDVLSGGVRHTVFSNGVEVYVNIAQTEADTPIGSVPANGFIFKEGEG